MTKERTYELKLSDGRVIRWPGRDGIDASTRAADCLRVSVVAWREPRTYVGPVHHSQIDG